MYVLSKFSNDVLHMDRNGFGYVAYVIALCKRMMLDQLYIVNS